MRIEAGGATGRSLGSPGGASYRSDCRTALKPRKHTPPAKSRSSGSVKSSPDECFTGAGTAIGMVSATVMASLTVFVTDSLAFLAAGVDAGVLVAVGVE